MADIATLQSRVRSAQQELTHAGERTSRSSQELIELMRSVERVIQRNRVRIEQQSTTIARQSEQIAQLERNKLAWDAERSKDRKLLAQLSSERDKLGTALDSLLTAVEAQQPVALGELVSEIRDRIRRLGDDDLLAKRLSSEAVPGADIIPSASAGSDLVLESPDAEARPASSVAYQDVGAPIVGDEPGAPSKTLVAIDRRIKDLLERSSDAGTLSHDSAVTGTKATSERQAAVRPSSLRHFSASPDHKEYRFWFWPKADENEGAQPEIEDRAESPSQCGSTNTANDRKTA